MKILALPVHVEKHIELANRVTGRVLIGGSSNKGYIAMAFLVCEATMLEKSAETKHFGKCCVFSGVNISNSPKINKFQKM